MTAPTAPTAWAGVVTVMLVAVMDPIVATVPPKVTELALSRFAPEIVTLVPPVIRPVFGERTSTTGAGGALVRAKVALGVPAVAVTL